MSLRVLVIGGYGTFGVRLAKLLQQEAALEILVGGRSQAKAEAFIATLTPAATFIPVLFDRDGDVAAQLGALAPHIVIDASGPFQDYGAQAYRVVEACIAHGMHYIDLADARDFVCGVARLDAQARAAGCFVIAGASTFPALTCAALRQLTSTGMQVDTIAIGIAPSPFAGMGLNVVRAIAGYAGKPLPQGVALLDPRRYTVALPGGLPLRSRRFSRVDVPDLQLAPALQPRLREIWAGAGTEPASLHYLLNFLAAAVRFGLLPSLAPAARLIHRAVNSVRWGEHRGGLFVQAEGHDAAGQLCTRSWHLIAEGDDGPNIPAMPAAALVQRCLRGSPPVSGARAATHELELADFDPLFARFAIRHGVRDHQPRSAPLYRRILGARFDDMPAALRALHGGSSAVFAGRARVERGSGLLARLLALVVGFPEAAADVPVQVRFTVDERGERWERNFAGRRFASFQSAGAGRAQYLVDERFGPVVVELAMVWEEERLKVVVRGWRMFGIRLPHWLAPGGETYEFEQDGRFHFHVEIAHPLLGLIVRYVGWLAPA